MMRRLPIRKRLERLEALLSKRGTAPGRYALIEMGPYDLVGERHLVMVSSPNAASCVFQERPGPGPGIADFGEFAGVLYVTTAEMEA